MNRKSTKPTNEKPKTAKPAKKRGRKPSRPALTEPVPPREGAIRLREHVNTLVSRNSGRIAQALIDKTISGNMSSARILVQLSGFDKLPEQEAVPSGPSMADILADEPACVNRDNNDLLQFHTGEVYKLLQPEEYEGLVLPFGRPDLVKKARELASKKEPEVGDIWIGDCWVNADDAPWAIEEARQRLTDEFYAQFPNKRKLLSAPKPHNESDH